MSYLGDIAAAQVLYFHFTTRQFSTGAPITSASLALSVYKDDSTTQSTSGVTTTFTSGFDSVAGLVSVKIDTSSDGTFYAAGHDFSVVVTTGTADSVSIVGEVVGYFSIANRAALRPTTAGRTLDVSAGGEAGVDWANVGSPTTSLALTGTTIAVTQKVDVDTIKTNPVVNGGTFTFPTNATGASTTNITGGTITTVTTLTNLPAITANWLTAAGTAADFGAEVATAIWTDITAGDFTVAASIGKSVMNGVALGTGLTIGAVSGAVGSVTGAVGSVTGNVGGNVTGSVGSVVGAVGSVTGAVGSVTGNVGGNVVGSVASVTATVNADVKKVNAVTVNGDGAGTPWGP